MKYISFLLLLGALYATWTAIHHPSGVSDFIHAGIQDDLESIIANYVIENVTEAEQFKIHKLWTEQLSDTQIKAHFLYSFVDKEDATSSEITIDGYAILNRDAKASANESADAAPTDVWSFDELFILNNKISFKDGLTISPDQSNNE